MKGELNRDRYCAGLHVKNNGRFNYCEQRDEEIESEICKGCRKYHPKWPTLEQYHNQYGEEYMDESPVWAWYNGWTLMSYRKAKDSQFELVVCACTPWGKPPEDWRPE